MAAIHDKPLAAKGLTSYRYKGPFGWIMIGAANDADAMREAARSTQNPEPEHLHVWNGATYVATQRKPYLDELSIGPTSGRLLARQSSDGCGALVGVLHFSKEFTPKEGASYLAVFAGDGFRVVPEIVDSDLPDEYQGYGMNGVLLGNCWRKTAMPGALTVRFVEAFPDENGWTIYGASNHPLRPATEYQRGHALMDVRQGVVQAVPMVDGAIGSTPAQLLSEMPIWPNANDVPHVMPTLEARWRQTYYEYSVLQAKFGAGELSESQLIDAVKADPKIFRIRSLSRDDRYCQYLAVLRDAGGIQLQRPMTVEEFAEREELSKSIVRRLMAGEFAPDAVSSKRRAFDGPQG